MIKGKTILQIVGFLGLVILALIPFAYDIFPFLPPGLVNNYTLHVLIVSFYYAVLASSWALLMGYAGQFSFAHMAFAGLAGYTTGMMGKFWGTGPLVGIIMGTIVAGLFGWIVGVLVLRLRSTYLALFTIAFAEIVRFVLNAEIYYTGGGNGLQMAPLFPNGIMGFDSVDKIPPYFLMYFLMLILIGFMYWLAGTRFGLFLRAIREDEEAAAAMGVNVIRYKVLVFVITSVIVGLVGGVRAHYITIISPNDMIILWMSLVITMAVLGGIESLIASAIGGVVIFVALEYLKTNFAFTSVMTAILTFIFGVILFQLGLYFAKRAGIVLKNVQKTMLAVGSVLVGLGIAWPIAAPLTTGLSFAWFDMTGSLLPEDVDMSDWRLVFFGLVLMLTLRFYQNGLLYPILERVSRAGTLAETVAKRNAAISEAEAGS